MEYVVCIGTTEFYYNEHKFWQRLRNECAWFGCYSCRKKCQHLLSLLETFQGSKIMLKQQEKRFSKIFTENICKKEVAVPDS